MTGALAVTVELPTYINAVQRTVADGNQISGGTILKLSEPNTVAVSSGATDPFGGIAAAEKVADDGATTLAAYMNGVFDLKTVATVGAEGAIVAGDQVMISGANYIKTALQDGTEDHLIIGTAEEDATGDEVIRVRLRGY